MTEVYNKFSDCDKRYLPRWEIHNPVHYQIPSQNFIKKGTMKDLSASGVRLVVEDCFFPSEELELTIYLSKFKYVTVYGKVIWARDLGGKHELGIDFINVGSDAQEVILNHAFELNKKEVSRNWFKDWSPSQ